jgi:hypothetical protein
MEHSHFMKAQEIIQIFRKSIAEYHLIDQVDANMPEHYDKNSFEYLLFRKNWIDTVQWHLEDIIRNPKIEPENLVSIKRKIDASNQDRTDTVELIDEFLFKNLKNVNLESNARLNSETPAWLLDRISILQLKIYHFQEQLSRKEIDLIHRESVNYKLSILKIQESDLENCYNELMDDLRDGKKYMRLYKQMKMYNDPNLNPVLYEK